MVKRTGLAGASIAAVLWLVSTLPVLSQGAILQAGPRTSGHAPMYLQSGSGGQTQVQDSGPASGGAIGLGLSELLQVNRTTTGTGPGGAHNCFYSAPITSLSGYYYLCLDANQGGAGVISYGAGGGASAQPLQFLINGALYPFPSAFTGIPIGQGNYYANASTGNDLNDCLAVSTSGIHGPCRTLQRVIAAASSYDANSSIPIIHLVGSFSSGGIVSGPMRGVANSGSLTYLLIDGGSASTTILDDTSSACFTFLASGSGTNVTLRNLTLQKSAGCAGGGASLFAQDLAAIFLSSGIVIGGSTGTQMHAESGATIEITANYSITGNAVAHWAVSGFGSVQLDGFAVTCNGVTAYSNEFALAQNGGWISAFVGSTFPSCGAVTGTKWVVQNGSIITSCQGCGGTPWTAFPGNAPGYYETGGRFDPPPTPSLGTCANGVLNASEDDIIAVSFSGNNSSCEVTFGNQKRFAPVCSASRTGGTVQLGTSTAAVSLIGSTTIVNGETVYILCRGNPY